MFRTPGGKPASETRSAIAKIASGSASGTLTTAVQPATSAGAVFCAMPGSGKLKAHSTATTPIGSRTTRLFVSYFMISAALVAGQRRQVGLAHLGELEVAAELRVVVPVQRRRDRVVDLGRQLGVAELVDDQVAELLLALGDQRGEALAHLGALLDRPARPVGLVERRAGGRDGAVDVGRRRRGHVADLLAGRRRHDVEALVGVRLLPAAVYVEVRVLPGQHGQLSPSNSGQIAGLGQTFLRPPRAHIHSSSTERDSPHRNSATRSAELPAVRRASKLVVT